MKMMMEYCVDRYKIRFAKDTVSKILSLGNIKNAYDFGCGTGLYVQELINQGIATTGFEISPGAKKAIRTAEKNIVWTNLERPLPSKFKPRDLVLTTEFLEHVSKAGGTLCCKEICELSLRWVVMTASPEKGAYHVNPQPRKYWIDAMTSSNTHEYRNDLSMDFINYFIKLIPSGLVWFKRDLMIFERTPK